jgi:hypothetical protein
MSIPSLYWATQAHDSPNIGGFDDMFNIAKAAMTAIGLTNVKRNQSDVSGVTNDTIAAVACTGCGTVYTLIVMVSSDVDSHAKTIVDKLLKEIPKHIPNL